MNTAVLFGKASDEWSTPQDCFEALHREFNFWADVAATSENRKCPAYLGPDQRIKGLRDGLAIGWALLANGLERRPTFWMNPPYSKCKAFIAKARAEALDGCTIVCLVPSRTDTFWWHAYVWDRYRHQPYPGVEIRFLKGRLKFGGASAGAPFPSVVIVFRPVT